MGIGNLDIQLILTNEDILQAFETQDTVVVEDFQTLELEDTLTILEGKTLVFRGTYTAPPDMDSFDVRGTLINESTMNFGNMNSGVVGIVNNSGNTVINYGHLYFDSSEEDSFAIRCKPGSKTINYGRITIRQIEPQSIGILVEDDAVYENYGVIECKAFGQKRLLQYEEQDSVDKVLGIENRFFGHDFDLEMYKDNGTDLRDTLKIAGLENTHFIKTTEKGLFINYNSGYINMSEMNRSSIVFEVMTSIMNNGYFVNMGNMLNTTIKNNRNFINGNCNEEYRYDDSIYQKQGNGEIDFTTLNKWCVATREGKPKYLRQCGTINFSRSTNNWLEKRAVNIDALFELLFFKQFFNVPVSEVKKTTIADMFDHLKDQSIGRDIIIMIPGWMSKFIAIDDTYKKRDSNDNIIEQVMNNGSELVPNKAGDGEKRYSHNYSMNFFLSWNDIKNVTLSDDDDYRVVAFFINVILFNTQSYIVKVQSTEYNKAWENAREYFPGSPEQHDFENDLGELFTIDVDKRKRNNYLFEGELINHRDFALGSSGFTRTYGISPKMVDSIDSIDPNSEYLNLLELISNKVGSGSLPYDNLKIDVRVGADDDNERRQGRGAHNYYPPPLNDVNFLTTEKSIGLEDNQLDIAGPLEWTRDIQIGVDLTSIRVMKGYFSVFKDAPQHEDAPNNLGDSAIPELAISYDWDNTTYFAYKQYEPYISDLSNRVDQPTNTSRFNLTYYFDFDKNSKGDDLSSDTKLYDIYNESNLKFLLRWWGEELKVVKKSLESLIGFYPDKFKTFTNNNHSKITNGIEMGVQMLGAIEPSAFNGSTASFFFSSNIYGLRINELTTVGRSSKFFSTLTKSLGGTKTVNKMGAGMALGDFKFGYVDYEPNDNTYEYFKTHINGSVQKDNDTHIHTFEGEDTVSPSDYISKILKNNYNGKECSLNLLHKAGLPKYVGLLILHESLHGLGLVALEPILDKLDKTDLVETIYVPSMRNAIPGNDFVEDYQRGVGWFKIFKGPIATQAYKNLLKDMYVNHIQLKDTNGNEIIGDALQAKKDSIITEIDNIQGIPYMHKNFPTDDVTYISFGHWLLDNVQRTSPDLFSIYESAPEITVNNEKTKYPLLHFEVMGSGGTIWNQSYLSPLSLAMLEDLGYILNQGARTIDAMQSTLTFLTSEQLMNETNYMNNILPHPLKSSTQIVVRPTFKKENDEILPNYEIASLFGFPDGTNGRELPYSYGEDVALPIKLNSRKKWHKKVFDGTFNVNCKCKIVVDNNNRRHLVYSSNFNLNYITSSDGVNWSDAIIFKENVPKRNFALAIDGNNKLYIAYLINGGIEVRSKVDGQSFTSPTSIGASDTNYYYVTLNIDSSNRVHVGYTDRFSIYYKVSDENGNFPTDPETVKSFSSDSPQQIYGRYLTSTMNSSSTKPIFVYLKADQSGLYFLYSLQFTKWSDDNNNWVDTDIGQSSTTTSTNHGKYLQIESDSNNDLHFAYYDVLLNSSIYKKFTVDTTQWSSTIKIKTTGNPSNADLSLVIDSNNKIQLFFYDFVERTNSNGQIYHTTGDLKHAFIEGETVKYRKIDYNDDYNLEFNIGDSIFATLDSNQDIHLVYQNSSLTKRPLIYNFLH